MVLLGETAGRLQVPLKRGRESIRQRSVRGKLLGLGSLVGIAAHVSHCQHYADRRSSDTRRVAERHPDAHALASAAIIMVPAAAA
jgi:hypothetical protein